MLSKDLAGGLGVSGMVGAACERHAMVAADCGI